jgi:flagellar biosynthetic protein FliO
MEWILLKTLLSLAAVLALMVGVVYVLKRYVYNGAQGGTQRVAVEVLGQRSLQPKRSIVVVKVLDTVFVIGMSEQGMQTLGTIENEESLAALSQKLGADEPSPGWFMRKGTSGTMTFANQLQESLRGFLRRGEGKNAPATDFVQPPVPSRKPRRRQ